MSSSSESKHKIFAGPKCTAKEMWDWGFGQNQAMENFFDSEADYLQEYPDETPVSEFELTISIRKIS